MMNHLFHVVIVAIMAATTQVTRAAPRSQLDDLNTRIGEMEQELSILQQAQKACTQEVAFHAIMPSDLTFGKGKTILYSGITKNSGNAYDKTTGIFTCTVPGIYEFRVENWSKVYKDSHRYYGRVHYVNLKLNSATVPNVSGEWTVLSNTLRLKAGDVVKVVTLLQTLIDGYKMNYFTGQLILSDGCQSYLPKSIFPQLKVTPFEG